jgi:hypothetical protein
MLDFVMDLRHKGTNRIDDVELPALCLLADCGTDAVGAEYHLRPFTVDLRELFDEPDPFIL